MSTRKTPVNQQEAEQLLEAIAVINTGVELLASTLTAQGYNAEIVVKPIFDSYKELVNTIGHQIGDDHLRYSFQAGTVKLDRIERVSGPYTIKETA
jgi:hypothetical protein